MSPADTFLDYGPEGKNQLSKSIQASFGIGDEEEWEPKHDKVFKFIIEDSFAGNEAGPGGTGTGDFTNYGKRVILPGEWTKEYRAPFNEERVEGTSIYGTEKETLEYSTEHGSDYLFVSLEYFLNKLLNVIINQSYIEERGIMDAQFVKDAPADPESSNTGRFQRVTSSQERKVVLPDPNIPKQFHSADLRSIDHKKVIINNINFYDNPDFFKTLRREV